MLARLKHCIHAQSRRDAIPTLNTMARNGEYPSLAPLSPQPAVDGWVKEASASAWPHPEAPDAAAAAASAA